MFSVVRGSRSHPHQEEGSKEGNKKSETEGSSPRKKDLSKVKGFKLSCACTLDT